MKQYPHIKILANGGSGLSYYSYMDAVNYIINHPELIQSDWAETSTGALSYIKNKYIDSYLLQKIDNITYLLSYMNEHYVLNVQDHTLIGTNIINSIHTTKG